MLTSYSFGAMKIPKLKNTPANVLLIITFKQY